MVYDELTRIGRDKWRKLGVGQGEDRVVANSYSLSDLVSIVKDVASF